MVRCVVVGGNVSWQFLNEVPTYIVEWLILRVVSSRKFNVSLRYIWFGLVLFLNPQTVGPNIIA